ncbi:MAG TPA: penicillin-binding transpeptidase domain-containing protein [Solirubrobacteraceae bacterium]|jgi:peptidoglycan glycosyltransferase
MNAPIARLFVVVVVLFAVLVAFTSRWTVFDAHALRDNPKNHRQLIEEQKIHRGLIRAGDDTVLARSLKQPDKSYVRTYPAGRLFSHAVGYSFVRQGRAGLERFYDDDLAGRSGELGSLLDRLSGSEQQGDNLVTSLNPAAQRVALQQLGGRKGAVVALDPRSGAIKVMASVPGYDPNAVKNQQAFSALNKDSDAPLLNRTTQAGYPPGSTFKVVTAIAAIDSGRYTPESRISGRNGKTISGVPLNNDQGESFGDITLTEALTKSVNTVFGEIGEKLGKAKMNTYMDRLGFGKPVEVDLPRDERAASGERKSGRIIPATNGAVDVGRMAIGQDKLTVTPLQMAMVASAVANGGKLMKPRLGDRIVDRDGRTVRHLVPEEMSQVMSPQTASQVGAMMGQVVKEGTGTAAALQGIDVAGKTGTAEVDRPCGPNQLWFIAFAPAQDPRVAIAATVECGTGFGGTVAAPIAKAVMQELLK